MRLNEECTYRLEVGWLAEHIERLLGPLIPHVSKWVAAA